MLRLPQDENGVVAYNGITSKGSLSAREKRVFIRAKGQLYLEENARKWEERAVVCTFGIAWRDKRTVANWIFKFGLSE